MWMMKIHTPNILKNFNMASKVFKKEIKKLKRERKIKRIREKIEKFM